MGVTSASEVTAREKARQAPGPVYPHPLLQEQVHLLRLLLPAPGRGQDGPLCVRPLPPAGGDRPADYRPHGGQRVPGRRHPLLPGGEAAAAHPQDREKALPSFPGRGDHPGGQPGQRRGLAGPPLPAPGGDEPAVPGGTVGGRRSPAHPGPPPHLRPGGGGGSRRPAGQDQKPLPGSHLWPARPGPGGVEGHPGAGGGPGAAAPELLRAEGGGGHPPVGHAGEDGPAGRRRPGGYVPVDGGAAGGPGV